LCPLQPRFMMGLYGSSPLDEEVLCPQPSSVSVSYRSLTDT